MATSMNKNSAFPFFFATFAMISLTGIETTRAESIAKAVSHENCKTGKRLYIAGDVLKAINNLEACVLKEPRNREAWVTLATAHSEAGQFASAVVAFGKAQAIRSGDMEFLASYLDALQSVGKGEGRIPVLKALIEAERDNSKHALQLLALADSLGAEKHAADRLFALEKLTQFPGAPILHQEKLAEAYLVTGQGEKAQAEYRGLLSKRPTVGEYWAGLGASISADDPAAALDCYHKAILYSNHASSRSLYAQEVARLEKLKSEKTSPQMAVAPDQAPASAMGKSTSPPSDSIASSVASGTPSVKAAPQPSATSTGASAKPPAIAAKPAAAPAFNIKAYQDSVYRTELEKRLAELRKQGKVGPANAPTPVASASAAPTKPAFPVTEGDKVKDAKTQAAPAKAKAEKAELVRQETAKSELAKAEAVKPAQTGVKKAEDERQGVAKEEAKKKGDEEQARQAQSE